MEPTGEWPEGPGAPVVLIRDSPGGASGPTLVTELCSAASRLFMLRMPSAKRVSWPFSSCCSWRMAVRSCCLLRQFWGEKKPPPWWPFQSGMLAFDFQKYPDP